jgi:hypothetical protein
LVVNVRTEGGHNDGKVVIPTLTVPGKQKAPGVKAAAKGRLFLPPIIQDNLKFVSFSSRIHARSLLVETAPRTRAP